jgi:hypothetical protein
VAKTLPELLTIYLERLKISNNAFAKKAGCVQATVSKTRHGGSPPADQEDKWADALDLEGAERAEFTAVYRATKAMAQARAVPHIEEIAQRIAELEALLLSLLPFLEEGRQVPKNILKAIKALRKSN